MKVLLALNNIRSLHNVGAIFRTCDGAGISGLILGGLTPTPPRHEIEKTALGATETVPWEYAQDLSKRLQELKTEGYTLYAIELTDKAIPLYEAELSFPAVFILGHEREGIEAEILSLCEAELSLPMRGTSAHSLNVSTTAGIVAYECVRRLCYDR